LWLGAEITAQAKEAAGFDKALGAGRELHAPANP
jgi:hypothetical protein